MELSDQEKIKAGIEQPADPDEAKLLRLQALISKEVKKAVNEALAEAVVPKGYERCRVCGDLVKIGRLCVTCAEVTAAEEKAEPAKPKSFLSRKFGL